MKPGDEEEMTGDPLSSLQELHSHPLEDVESEIGMTPKCEVGNTRNAGRNAR